MNINPMMEAAFEGIEYPVDPISHEGNEDTYIVYYTIMETGESFAEGEEIAGGTYASVSIFTTLKSKIKGLAADVKSRLKQAGFRIQQCGPENFDPESKYYNYPIDVYIEEGTEG